MSLRKQKIDPFQTISEKEVLWQEISEAEKSAVKGDEREVMRWPDSRNASADDVHHMWANRREQKKIGPTRLEQ